MSQRVMSLFGILAVTLGSNFVAITLSSSIATAAVPLNAIAVGHGQKSIAFDSLTDTGYVVTSGENAVSVFDGATNTVIDTIAVGNDPMAVAVDETTDMIYVTNNLDDTVSVIDGYSNTVSGVVTVESNPTGLAVDDETNTIYVSNSSSNSVSSFIGSDLTDVTTVNVGTNPDGISVDDATDMIFVADEGSNQLSAITGTTNSVDSVTVGSDPDAVSVDEASNEILVTNSGSDTVSVLNAENISDQGFVNVGSGPDAVTINPMNDDVFISNRNDSTISVLTNSGLSQSLLNIGSAAFPDGLAMNDATDTLYISSLSPNISTFAARANEVVATIANPLGNGSLVAVNSATNTTYEVDGNNGTLNVISGGANIVTATYSNVAASPTSVAVDSETTEFFIASGVDGSVEAFSAANNEVFDTVNGLTGAQSIALDDENGTMYVAGSNALYCISIGTLEITHTLSDLGALSDVVFDSTTDMVYVANTSGDLYIINGATNTEVGSPLSVGLNSTLAVNTTTGTIYAASPDSKNLLVISGTTNTITTSIHLDNDPTLLAVNSSTNLLYVGFPESTVVDVIDGATDAVAQALGVLTNINSIAANPITDAIYAGGDTDILVLNGATTPSAPVVTGSAVGANCASIAWDDVLNSASPVTSYEVSAAPVGGGEATTVSLSPTTTNATITGLQNGTSYNVTVTADNDMGAGSPSLSTTMTPAGPPESPLDVWASSGNGSANVTWITPNDEGTPITSYSVSTFDGLTLTGAPQVTTGTSLTVSGLTNGDSYHFVVTATNAVGTSFGSSSAAVSPHSTPDAPGLVASSAGNARVSLSWSAPSDNGLALLFYVVSLTPSQGSPSMTFEPTSVTSWSTHGLINGDAYTVAVVAVNSDGDGDMLSELLTPSTVPSAPRMVKAVGGSDDVTISWHAPQSTGGSPITGYDVFMGTKAGKESSTPSNALVIPASAHTHTVKKLKNGTIYYLYVKALNENGSSGPSVAVSVRAT